MIGKQISSLKLLLVDGIIEPIFSQQLFDEIALVTQKPKLQKYFSQEEVNDLMDFLKQIGVLVEIRSSVLLCRDPKDNYLLALAQDSEVDYLITGDRDLLTLENFAGVIILTYQDFISTTGIVTEAEV